MKTYKMRLQNKPIYENSSKSDNGKVVKYTGKIFCGGISQGVWGGGKFGGGISKKKPTNFHSKINLCTKFHSNRKMVKFRGKIFWGVISQGGILKK